MEEWHRRSVLATGAALSAGGLASIGAGSEGNDAADLPDPDVSPNPEMADEDWPSFAGDAGHARFVEDGHEFDGESLEAAWSVDHDGSVAVADDTVYATTADGVVALDAADGALVWENTDVDARDPAVAGETVYLGGDEIVALDREDGSVRWESDLGAEDVSAHTVAYDGVFVVADGTLYALEADDGSTRWEIESITNGDREDHFIHTAAAANGVVYATTPDVAVALEPETGEEVWRHGEEFSPSGSSSGTTLATTAAVVVGRASFAEREIVDAQTGEGINIAPSEGVSVTIGNEIYVGGTDFSFDGGSLEWDSGYEYRWQKDIHYSSVSSVISGDTVYAYFYDAGHPPHADYDEELVAFDKYDGTEKWVLSRDDAPVGPIRAISGETIYVDHDGELVALREGADDEDAIDEGDENGDGEQGDEGGDDGNENPDDGDAGESDDTGGDEDTPDETDETGGEDGDETDDSESDCPNEGTDSECDGNGSSDDSTGSDDDSLGDDGSDEGGDDGDTDTDDQTENGTTDVDDDSDTDGVPGFTTGAGLVGGALGLEWLRRRADADETAE